MQLAEVRIPAEERARRGLQELLRPKQKPQALGRAAAAAAAAAGGPVCPALRPPRTLMVIIERIFLIVERIFLSAAAKADGREGPADAAPGLLAFGGSLTYRPQPESSELQVSAAPALLFSLPPPPTVASPRYGSAAAGPGGERVERGGGVRRGAEMAPRGGARAKRARPGRVSRGGVRAGDRAARALGGAPPGGSTGAPPRPPPRTKWTRRVPHPVLIGHAASLTPY